MSSEEVIRVSYCWAKHFTSIHNEDLEINTHQSSTHPKSERVIRDQKGTWILGYNRFLGKCSVAIAEL
ncbi:hypothetical protein J1N35_035079 [Gossypium stocksii]|uniref:Uncharacterized protein n=1 Tax=Gossypium stocksii TaxID=47602 RepID=A0A9D3UU32_9ROSI|nr:hypothetical protein J1N35_035079 [Gossypium stocksii]